MLKESPGNERNYPRHFIFSEAMNFVFFLFKFFQFFVCLLACLFICELGSCYGVHADSHLLYSRDQLTSISLAARNTDTHTWLSSVSFLKRAKSNITKRDM